jgi:phosphoribosylamine--glycine ligase
VRFGDPETQAILVRLRTDLSEILLAMAHGTLANINLEWASESSACVVLASGGYPGKYESGAVITGLSPESDEDCVQIFHAGTAQSASGNWITAGGRVLGVTAIGENLADALAHGYRRITKIHWEGMQYRRDIGTFLSEPPAVGAGQDS